MKRIFYFIVLLLPYSLFSQNHFEKGYIIKNEGEKEICLINNLDWEKNPTQIEYKALDSDKINQIRSDNLLEFGIGKKLKYKKYTVLIDRSSENPDEYTKERKPLFNKESLLLKVLIEGKASLYEYIEEGFERYFYNLNDGELQQLIFKKYVSSDNSIKTNETYKQQLFLNLQCVRIHLNSLKRLNYNQYALIRLFTKYNKCRGVEFINYEKNNQKSILNLSVRWGISRYTFNCQYFGLINKPQEIKSIDFDNKMGSRIGMEAELILPFNNKKFGIIVEPTYQHYEADNTKTTNYIEGEKRINSIDLTSIEIPVGIRYYILLKKDSKIFINTSHVFDFNINPKPNNEENTYREFTKHFYAFGLGYTYHRFFIESRYQKLHKSLGCNVSNFKNLSVILGFRFY